MNRKHIILSQIGPLLLTLVLFIGGCSRPESKDGVGRFQLVFPPANSKSKDTMYFVNTSTGRLWSMGIRREVVHPDGTGEIEWSEWKEETITGLSGSHH